MPTQERLGTDDRENLQDRRKPSIQLDEEAAVVVGEPDPAAQFTPQNDQLMSKYRILRFKPNLRPEQRDQNAQDEAPQSDHPASLCDSVTSSTQIGFSVHTGLTDTLSAVRARVRPGHTDFILSGEMALAYPSACTPRFLSDLERRRSGNPVLLRLSVLDLLRTGGVER